MTHITIARPDDQLNAVPSLEGVLEFLRCLYRGTSAERFNPECMIAGETFFYAETQDIELLEQAYGYFAFTQKRKEIPRRQQVSAALLLTSGITDTSAIQHGLMLPEMALLVSIMQVRAHPGRSLVDAVHVLINLKPGQVHHCPDACSAEDTNEAIEVRSGFEDKLRKTVTRILPRVHRSGVSAWRYGAVRAMRTPAPYLNSLIN